MCDDCEDDCEGCDGEMGIVDIKKSIFNADEDDVNKMGMGLWS